MNLQLSLKGAYKHCQTASTEYQPPNSLSLVLYTCYINSDSGQFRLVQVMLCRMAPVLMHKSCMYPLHVPSKNNNLKNYNHNLTSQLVTWLLDLIQASISSLQRKT